jgi:hypothetical protein
MERGHTRRMPAMMRLAWPLVPAVVDDEVGLHGRNVVAAAGDQVATVEPFQGVFDELVEPAVLALAGERDVPARQACDLAARRNPDDSAVDGGRGQLEAANAPMHRGTPVRDDPGATIIAQRSAVDTARPSACRPCDFRATAVRPPRPFSQSVNLRKMR